MATRQNHIVAVRDQRYSWALSPLPPRAVIRYWTTRVAAHTQQAGRFVSASNRRLARGVAAIMMMLALLAESRRLRPSRPTQTRLAMKPDTASDGNPPTAASSPSSQSQAPVPKVTVTPAGVRVVDKRRAAVRPATAEPGGAGAVAESLTQPQPADEVQQQSRWFARAVTKVSDAVWFPMLGRLIRAGRRTPLPMAPDLDVGRYAWRHTACRQLLRDKSGRAECLPELIDLAADETAGDWRSPVVWWAKRHVSPADLVRFVQAELIRPGHAALPDRRLILVLRLAGHAAAALPDGDARAVIRTALACARKQVDPYSANGLTLVARSVVSILLEQRPELDEIVISALELQAGESQMPPDRPLPVEARLLAIATRNRAPDFGTTLSRAAVKSGFGPAQMEATARLADAPFARSARLREAERIRAPLAVVMFVMGRGLPWLTPVVVAAGVGIATHLLRWAPAHTMISVGDSIALLALLAAVNVFTVQLSASRLPGVIARSAGQPWELFFSYSAALTLLGLSVFRAHAAWLVAASSWAVLAALVLFSAGVLPAMFRLLRRTDAGRAAGGYVARTVPMARVAGRRLGRIQARAVEMREALETVPAVRMSPDAFAGEWSQNIAARARGFFIPSRAGMRRLLAHSTFGEGMRLRVFAGLGTIVGSGDDIVSLIPARDQSVTKSLARQAGRRLRTRSCSRVEDVATGAVALTQMALDLANAGDIGTSRTVAQNVVRLVTEHTAAARRARTQMFRQQEMRVRAAEGGLCRAVQAAQVGVRARDTSIVPVVPALRDSMRIAVRGRLESRKDLFNVPGAIIEQLLSSSGQADAALSMMIFSVPAEASESAAGSSIAAELLRIAGVRALELRDSTTFEQVLDQLGKHSSNGTEIWDAAEVTGMLAATACRFDVRLAKRAIDRSIAQIAVSPVDETGAAALAARRRLIVLWRAGAAGLACGAISVTVHAANKLLECHMQDALDTLATDRGLIAWEAARSNLHSGYLGDHAKDALANFGTFLKGIKPVLTHPDEGEVTQANSS